MDKPVPEDVVETIARAICMACDENPNHKGDARGNDFRWQDYRAPALAAINALAGEMTALVEALERIASWPDGGNQYGQSRIKAFAAKTLATYYKGDV